MKTTNGQAFGILSVLTEAKETGKLGYALAKQRRLVETELKEFIDIRNKAIQENVADGKLTEAGAAKANATIAEIIDLPCEFPVYMISEDVFTSGGLTSEQMYTLDFMVEG